MLKLVIDCKFDVKIEKKSLFLFRADCTVLVKVIDVYFRA